MEQFGSIKIKLDELIQKRGISKNKLCQRAQLQHTQLNHFCKNEITRLDTDVLARICTVLDCRIEDLLEFVPPSPNGSQ
ncbi:MAG: helix-turn-helix transcriptional regulator [Clostridia bacterium]|nr:helix-turn-helix transcriptional regulator [Clostridia bacterium]